MRRLPSFEDGNCRGEERDARFHGPLNLSAHGSGASSTDGDDVRRQSVLFPDGSDGLRNLGGATSSTATQVHVEWFAESVPDITSRASYTALVLEKAVSMNPDRQSSTSTLGSDRLHGLTPVLGPTSDDPSVLDTSVSKAQKLLHIFSVRANGLAASGRRSTSREAGSSNLCSNQNLPNTAASYTSGETTSSMGGQPDGHCKAAGSVRACAGKLHAHQQAVLGRYRGLPSRNGRPECSDTSQHVTKQLLLPSAADSAEQASLRSVASTLRNYAPGVCVDEPQCPYCNRTTRTLGKWCKKYGYSGQPYCRACKERFWRHIQSEASHCRLGNDWTSCSICPNIWSGVSSGKDRARLQSAAQANKRPRNSVGNDQGCQILPMTKRAKRSQLHRIAVHALL